MRVTDAIGFAAVARCEGEVATLTVVTGPGAGAVHVLDAPRVILGRGLDADVVIPDGAVSRLHAQITREGRDYVFEDLNSRNGSFLNCTLVGRPVTLMPGDVVQLGVSTRVSFALADGREGVRPPTPLVLWDPVSGLLSEPAFEDQLLREMSFASRHGMGLSLIVLEIEYLERIRHRHGRRAVERVLGVVGRSLGEVLRTEDLAARIAGDAIGVVVRGIGDEGVAALGERLRACVASNHVLWSGRRLPLSASVGVAHSRDATTVAALVAAARASSDADRCIDAPNARIQPLVSVDPEENSQ